MSSIHQQFFFHFFVAFAMMIFKHRLELAFICASDTRVFSLFSIHSSVSQYDRFRKSDHYILVV